MSNLTGNNIKDTYQGLLKLADSTTGITSTLQYVQDGLGNNVALQVSNNTVNVTGSLLLNGSPISGGSGSSGTSGSSGSSGSSGQAGSSGTSGSSGSSGQSGSSGTSGTSGTSGDSIFAQTGSVWNTTNNIGITGSFDVSGTTTLNGNTVITGSLYVSSSVSNDVTVDGRVFIFSNGSGANSTQLVVSSSLSGGGISTISPNSITQASGSLSGTVSRTIIVSVDSVSAPTTNRLIGISANPSLVGAPSITGVTVPSILAMNNSSQPEAIVNFQHRGGYTDGRMTILKPVVMNSGSFITGSVSSEVRNVTISSLTGSIDLNTGNFFNVPLGTSSSDIRLEFSSVKPGQTINLKVVPHNTNTVSFGPNVLQPSGSAYVPTQTSGSIDVLTLVSFDSSDLLLANVKNFI